MHRVLTFALAIVLSSSGARAAPPQPLGAADILGARSLALSAFRGLAGGNDGIFFNPAGLAARRRYALEAQYLNDRVGADAGAQFIGLSVVDSSTSSLTGGLAWTRIASGQYIGNVFQLALAAPLSQGIYAGASGKFLSLNGPLGVEVRSFNADLGLFWTVNEMLTVGAAGYNLFSASNRQVMPRGVGAGIGVGNGRTFNIAADWRSDFDRNSTTTHAFGVGGEILVADLVPLRAGYLHDDILGGQWWSVGAGIVSASGVALDLSYRQSFEDPSRRTIAAALKVFLSSQ